MLLEVAAYFLERLIDHWLDITEDPVTGDPIQADMTPVVEALESMQLALVGTESSEASLEERLASIDAALRVIINSFRLTVDVDSARKSASVSIVGELETE